MISRSQQIAIKRAQAEARAAQAQSSIARQQTANAEQRASGAEARTVAAQAGAADARERVFEGEPAQHLVDPVVGRRARLGRRGREKVRERRSWEIQDGKLTRLYATLGVAMREGEGRAMKLRERVMRREVDRLLSDRRSRRFIGMEDFSAASRVSIPPAAAHCAARRPSFAMS